MDNQLFDLRKALDTSTTNSNNVLSPVILSKAISDWARRQPAIRNIIKRIPWNTMVYTWDTVTSHGAAELQPDGATLSLIDAAFRQDQAKMSFIYHTGLITNPAILADQELVDVVEMRVGQATKSVLKKENATIYAGDAANAQNPGLVAALTASSTFGVIGAGATANRGMFATMATALEGEGYQPGAYVVSPRVYNLIKQAAFNNVRFIGIDGDAAVGFSLALTKNVTINGLPVIMDKFAETPTAVSNETLTLVSGKTYKFANQNVYTTAGNDQAGTSWAAPTFTGGGTSPVFSLDANGNTLVTFSGTPSAPTATYTYGADNVFLLSLDPSDLVIAEMLPLTVDMDLAKPVQQDAIPFRVKEYSVLAVRNPKAHVLAQNVSVPALSSF